MFDTATRPTERRSISRSSRDPPRIAILTKDVKNDSISIMNPLSGRVLFSFMLGFLPFSSQAQPVQWTTNSGGNGHFYEAVVAPSGITWGDAQSAAVSRGGYLASITSVGENNFAYGLISGNLAY